MENRNQTIQVTERTAKKVQNYVNGLPVFQDLADTYLDAKGIDIQSIVAAGGKVFISIPTVNIEIAFEDLAPLSSGVDAAKVPEPVS